MRFLLKTRASYLYFTMSLKTQKTDREFKQIFFHYVRSYLIIIKNKVHLKSMHSFFSVTKGAWFWGTHFKVTNLFSILFSLKVWGKREALGNSYVIQLYSVDFLLPFRAKIFTRLIRNWQTAKICSVNLGVLLFKMLMIYIMTFEDLVLSNPFLSFYWTIIG